ncbi:sugar ABC transporter substrate-binding protein [Bavariicoccus seileri]|uniref:sugar ABC transporter substrate-binding protein n=1 Tax=Bavariicoccus seileri TaxID=549685 RepID=UPI0003B45AAE|nr:sugar ABC transporter substrate-binding protein [Bavariicoccus seileri]
MKFKKRMVALGALAVASIGLMAGCSNGGSDSSSSDELTFWYMGDGDQGIKPIVDDFTEETGIKVKIQSIPWSSSRDKLLTAVASKGGPDVVQMGSTYMSEFVDAGALLDITEDVEGNDTLKPTNFFDGSVETTKFDDKYYAVPWYTETRALYYRTDLLESVGYSEAPKTWDELADAAQKLSERGDNMYGFNVDASEPTFGFMFARQNGSELFDDNTTPLFNQPEMVEALDFLYGMVESGAAPSTDLGLDISQGFGGDGVVPMFISGPWMINAIEENAPDIEGKWAVAELPAGPVSNTSVTGGANLAVFSSSKKKDDAIKLIEFLSRPENQTAFFENTNSLPTSQSAWEDDVFTTDPHISVFGEQLNESQPMPLMKEWDEITQNYLKEWEQVVAKSKDVQTAMDDLTQQTENILK